MHHACICAPAPAAGRYVLAGLRACLGARTTRPPSPRGRVRRGRIRRPRAGRAQVSAQLGLLLGAGKLGSQEEALGTLLQAFTDLVFDPELVREGRSVVRARVRMRIKPPALSFKPQTETPVVPPSKYMGRAGVRCGGRACLRNHHVRALAGLTQPGPRPPGRPGGRCRRQRCCQRRSRRRSRRRRPCKACGDAAGLALRPLVFTPGPGARAAPGV